MTCPRCSQDMVTREHGRVTVTQCPQGHGVFLERADLGNLIDAETQWHRSDGHQTQPLPRITPDMAVPPPAATRARAYVETLFD